MKAFTRLMMSIIAPSFLALRVVRILGVSPNDAYTTLRYTANWAHFGQLNWNLNDPKVGEDAYSDDSGHPFRTKAARCRSGATLGMTYVPEWPD